MKKRKAAKRHLVGGYRLAPHDLYPSDPDQVRGLLKVEKFKGTIWEPACGDGVIVKILRRRGYKVIATDLVSHGCGRGGVDFLKETKRRADIVFTNPPFSLWLAFARHALKLGVKKLVLLGSIGIKEGRAVSEFMRATKMARMVQPVGRVKILPHGARDKGHSPRAVYCWYVWERGNRKPTIHLWYDVRPAGAPIPLPKHAKPRR